MIEQDIYGAVYWRYGGKYWAEGATLEEVVEYIGYGSDNGDLSYNEDDFYELTDKGWVSIDENIIKELFDQRDARESQFYKSYETNRKEKPWHLMIIYPQMTELDINKLKTVQSETGQPIKRCVEALRETNWSIEEAKAFLKRTYPSQRC